MPVEKGGVGCSLSHDFYPPFCNGKMNRSRQLQHFQNARNIFEARHPTREAEVPEISFEVNLHVIPARHFSHDTLEVFIVENELPRFPGQRLVQIGPDYFKGLFLLMDNTLLAGFE